jgi:DivIVA protein
VVLDRQSIEKKDFPIGRRGYDPEAVATHLAALAEEVEKLKRSARRRSESLAAAASEQVRAIVEAAETPAAEIQRHAERDAEEIRSDANKEALTTREGATTQAREYVGKVSESTAGMLERLDAMESELNALVESLRTGSNRLNADLTLLAGNLNEVKDAVAPRPNFVPEGEAAITPTVQDEEAEEAAEFEEEDVEEEELEAEDDSVEISDELEEGADDAEGARLIALNMALNGTPREETDRYLAENFELDDRRGLLDEVYASVEG